MKKLIIMAVSLLTITAASFAGTVHESIPVLTKTISSKVAFQHIVINGDVNVVLVENEFVQVDVTGEQKSVETVSYYVKKGTLYINRKHSPKSTNPVVTISVNDLQSLEVNGDGDVISYGSLHSKKLKLVLKGESKFNVRNLGEILLEADSNIDVQFEKYQSEEKLLSAVTPDAATVHEADIKMDEQIIKSVDTAYFKN